MEGRGEPGTGRFCSERPLDGVWLGAFRRSGGPGTTGGGLFLSADLGVTGKGEGGRFRWPGGSGRQRAGRGSSGGAGNEKASGALITGNLDDVRDRVVKAARDFMGPVNADENGSSR